MKPTIVIDKTNNKIISWGYADKTNQLKENPNYQEIEVSDKQPPDDIACCKWNGKEIVVDNILKQKYKANLEWTEKIREKMREIAIRELNND